MWDTFLPVVLTACAAILGSIALLLKVITSSYGSVVSLQKETIKSLVEQGRNQQAQLTRLREILESQSRRIHKLRYFRVKDREHCRKEIEDVKAELMTKIHQCPVLMGEVPDGNTCPFQTKGLDKDRLLPPNTEVS